MNTSDNIDRDPCKGCPWEGSGACALCPSSPSRPRCEGCTARTCTFDDREGSCDEKS